MNILLVDDAVTRLLKQVVAGFDFTNLPMELSFTYWNYTNATAVAVAPRLSKLTRGELQSWGNSFYLLRRFAIECNDEPGYDSSLEYIVNNFNSFTKLFESAFATAELMERTLPRKCLPLELFGPELAIVRSQFSRLKELVSQMTPAHLALQGYFIYLAFAGGAKPIVEQKYFSHALSALRDEYFVTPSTRLLSEYCLVVDKLIANELYPVGPLAPEARALDARMLEGINRCAATLEVTVLIEDIF